MTEDNKPTREQREETRNIQLEILKSKPLKNFVIASAGRDKARYGEIGEQATHAGYAEALSNPDEYLGSMTSNAFLGAEQEAGELYGGAVTPLHLLKTAKAFYFGGINKIKVSDILGLMGSEVSEDTISSSQKDMYMEDFKVDNEETYNKLITAYVQSIEMTGVGKAIAESGKSLAGNLERILTQKDK